MEYTGYELLWLFFLYSFLGWVLETVFAAVKQKYFANRGLINGPFCIIYGIAGVAMSVVLTDLPMFWIFVGGTLLATVIEWTAGHLIERLYHERWWDYSNMKWNMDGYICLPVSLVWGALGVAVVCWGNSFLLAFFRACPLLLAQIILWVLFAVMLLDVAATLTLLSGRSKNAGNWAAVDGQLDKVSKRLGRFIFQQVDKRIHKAYPKARSKEAAEKHPEIFAYGCSFYKIVLLFFIGAFLGDLTETVFCRITAGVWMSRSSVVWGSFSIVWGLAAVVWFKKLYPRLSAWIERIPVIFGKAVTWCLVVFMVCNVMVSCMAMLRYNERSQGIPAESGWRQTMDERFDDARMKRIYPNAIQVNGK